MKLLNLFTSGDGKKKDAKKIIFLAFLASLLFFFLASTHFVHAQADPPAPGATGGSAAGALLGAAADVALNPLKSVGAASFLADLAYTVIGKIAFGVSYLIAWAGGICIGIAAWLVSMMLSINNTVFQATIVTEGFRLTLAVANLGFVLGIIIIAIATILRNQTYGIKQLLWKLVAAAILVNFSLVIMAPIFSFSNAITQYFLNCSDPATTCNPTTNSSGIASTNTFAMKLAGSFNPQVGFLTLNKLPASTITTDSNSTQGAMAAVGGDFGQMLVPIFSIAFVALESIMIVIVLFALVIMLFMRYLYIAILAILMPFAWLCWVFPKLNSHWSKWWAEFIRWTLFAPICVFFLYLAILSLQAGSNTSQSIATYVAQGSAAGGAWSGISSLFTSAFTPIIQNVLNMLVMLGLSVAGLIVANSMGIKGADIGMKAVGAVKDSAIGYAGKLGKKGGRAAYQKAGGAKLTKSLQEGRIGTQLKRIPLVGGVIGGVVGRGESLAGRAIAGVSTNAAMVEDAKKGVPKDRESVLGNLKGSMNTEDTFAHLDAAIKGKYLKEDTLVNGKKAKDYLDENRDVVKRFGQGKTLDDANKLFMSDSNYRGGENVMAAQGKKTYDEAYKNAIDEGRDKDEAKEAGKQAVQDKTKENKEKLEAADTEAKGVYDEEYEKAIAGGKDEKDAKAAAEKMVREKTDEIYKNVSDVMVKVVDDIKDDLGNVIYKAGDKVSAPKLMDVSMQQFIKGLTSEDASKIDANALFGPAAPAEAIESRLKNIALFNPKLMPNLYKNMKFATIVNMQDKYAGDGGVIAEEKARLDNEIATTNADSGLADEVKKGKVAELTSSIKRLDSVKSAFEKIQKASYSYFNSERDDEEKGKEKGPAPAPGGGGAGGTK